MLTIEMPEPDPQPESKSSSKDDRLCVGTTVPETSVSVDADPHAKVSTGTICTSATTTTTSLLIESERKSGGSSLLSVSRSSGTVTPSTNDADFEKTSTTPATSESHCENDMEETEKLQQPGSYFDFLEDYIRFDVARTGVSCFSGYSVSVQYEDDFLLGKAGASCCCWNLLCSAKSRVRLWHEGKPFELEYLPKVSCIRPKNCIYRLKIPKHEKEIGTIHFREDLVHIYNAYEKCLSLRRKHGTNTYAIKTEAGDRLASIEIFRGFRGDIMNYGLSILGDASATDKALLIGLALAMDIRQRESEMRCTLLWVPLCCIVVIGLFSLLPWLYFYDDNVDNR